MMSGVWGLRDARNHQIDSGGCRKLRPRLRWRPDSTTVFLAKLIHAASRVDNLLLPGIERMTGGADFDMQVFPQRGSSRELVATAAGHFDLFILGVNVRFHDILAKTRISNPRRGAVQKRGILTIITPRRNRGGDKDLAMTFLFLAVQGGNKLTMDLIEG